MERRRSSSGGSQSERWNKSKPSSQERLSRQGSTRSVSINPVAEPEPVAAVLDWQPLEEEAKAKPAWLGCCREAPRQAQQMITIQTPGSPNSITFASPEHKAFYEVMKMLQRIRSEDFLELKQVIHEEKKALNRNFEQVVEQVQELQIQMKLMKETLGSDNDKVTMPQLEELMDRKVLDIEKLMKKNKPNVPIDRPQRKEIKDPSAVTAQSAQISPDYKPDDGEETPFGAVNSMFSQDFNEGSMQQIRSSPIGVGGPNKGKDKGKDKERRNSLSSTTSKGSVKDKRLAGKRKSNKLKLARDDYDTTLFMLADKVEVDQLVEQAMANLNLSDDWLKKLSPTDGRVTRIIRNGCFKLLVNIVILTNVLIVAIQSEHAVSQAQKGENASALFALADVCFCGFFSVEIILRLMGDRLAFFVGPDCRWNICDLIFVLLDVVNQLLYLVFSGAENDYVSTLRTGAKMVRLVRTARALRMFRVVRSSIRARLLLEETIASASLGFWLTVVLLVLFMFFGLFFMQASADVLLDSNSPPTLQAQILKHFGTAPDAVLSLYSLISGGTPWSGVYDALVQVDNVYGYVFLAFIFLMLLLFLNVVTGVFVDSATRRSKHHEMDNKSAEADRTRELLEKAELDDINGFVSKREFLNFLSSPYGKDQLLTLGLESAEALGIYDLLDKGGKHAVNINDLASGCARFTHPPRSVDHVSVLLKIKQVHEEQKNFAKFVAERFDQLAEILDPEAAAGSMRAMEDMAEKFQQFERRMSLGTNGTND